ncbi:MAG: hypothetical protein HQ553_03120 [Chloroflexi bacterium]|nr:hypothetical protein [Chloroflexota bacterium]
MRKYILVPTLILVLMLASLLIPSLALATAPTPAPADGSEVVDGNSVEWDLSTDFFADMYRAGDPLKPLESKLYLRYDCATSTMYVLVLTVDDLPALIEPEEGWVAINVVNNKVVLDTSGNDGTPPDWEWAYVGFDENNNHARGYEASFVISEGSYKLIAHVNVWDENESQTSSTGEIDLVVACPLPPVPEFSTIVLLSLGLLGLGGFIWFNRRRNAVVNG